MPQPKSTSRTRPPPQAPEEGSALQDQLSRLLLPLELVLLTRDRIRAVLDDAVSRGRMTRTDATDLAAALFERGRRQTEDQVTAPAHVRPVRVLDRQRGLEVSLQARRGIRLERC